MNKKNVDEIFDESREKDNSLQFWCNKMVRLDGKKYNKNDFWIFYKIEKMFQLNIISLADANHLTSLYIEKCQKTRIIKRNKEAGLLLHAIFSRVSEINEELSYYGLLPENVEIKNLIDESIMHDAPILRRKRVNKNI